uniref:dnaJ homolog subfamily C member 16-like n=1 Tax=Erigeron canadensis TaxID=72917 RepID=UPI001CB93E66|nr:dnaJ homolog subfamily C member 16-like [Erigeron canadensis]
MGFYDVDHYKVLGLPSGVAGTKISQTDIAKAYKKKALELHPDKRRPECPSYEILRNEKTRKDFDDNFVVRSSSVNKQDQPMKRKRQPTTAGFEEDDLFDWAKMSDFDRRKRAAAFRRRVYEVKERNRAAEYEKRWSEVVSEERKRRAAFVYGSNPKERILQRMQNMPRKRTFVF